MNVRMFRGIKPAGPLALLSLCLTGGFLQGAESTFVYAVQLSAAVQAAPATITLSWLPDPFGAFAYTVYRKSKTDPAWGSPLAYLDGGATGYADHSVSEGVPYEYQVVKEGSLGYYGYGYIFSGINVPAVEQRGTVVLVVAAESVVGLEPELARLAGDLVGDGWRVRRVDVSVGDTPESVRRRIQTEYRADPGSVNTVFLLGHVPVLRSGDLNYDGHAWRAMPADAFYGNMDDDWSTAPAWSPSYLPSDVELMVGRVDLADMPGAGATVPWPSETELLRNYLNKDHAWRHGQVSVPVRALMGNSRGDEEGLATAASGYRSFGPLVGFGNIQEANVQYMAPDTQRWIYRLGAGAYLWAYGNGAGGPNSCGTLGTRVVNGIPGNLYSVDVVAWDAQAVFVMLFGSWFGEWDHPDNLLRAFLATPGIGLASCMSGEPHWFVHHMGLGETIGYSARLTMNNQDLYRNQDNPYTRAVYIALMGDPTLRLHPVASPGPIAATSEAGGVRLNWGAVGGNVLGYHVYRANGAGGPFTRLTGTAVTGTSYLDAGTVPGTTYDYMVRAVALQVSPGGSYYNLSQGVFAKGQASGSPIGVPPPWQSTDIGAVGLAGWASYIDGVFTVAGSGADIWGGADSFHFVCEPWTGDGQITARVAGIGDTDGWAKVGVMWRENLDPGSPHAFMLVSLDQGTGLESRLAQGGETSYTAGPMAVAPHWVRLVRQGTSFTAQASTDGQNWTAVGTVPIPMAANAYVGLAVTAHNNSAQNLSVLDSVQVIGGPPNPPKLAIQSVTGGALTLELSGSPGVFIIQGSQDLTSWTDLATLTNTSTTAVYTDSSISANPARFYRAIAR